MRLTQSTAAQPQPTATSQPRPTKMRATSLVSSFARQESWNLTVFGAEVGGRRLGPGKATQREPRKTRRHHQLVHFVVLLVPENQGTRSRKNLCGDAARVLVTDLVVPLPATLAKLLQLAFVNLSLNSTA